MVISEDRLQKRYVAYKVLIRDILNSRFVKNEGGGASYFEFNQGYVFRVNIIGVVVQRIGGNFTNLLIEDGTGRMSARAFDKGIVAEDVGVGEVVLIVGRPREYANEKYILIEIIRKVDPRWATVRKSEFKDVERIIKEDAGDKTKPEFSRDKILKAIKELDRGDGVSVDDLPANEVDVDELVNVLLREGDIFEVRPGRLKVLE